MYCPKCSQEQVSDEMCFCSRCGFSLIAVRELIASGTGLVEPAAEKAQLSRGQRGVRRGVWMMLASLPLTLVVAFLAARDDGFAVLGLVPFLCFVVGFLRMLYGVFIADKRAASRKRVASQPHVVSTLPARSATAADRSELSAPRVAPIENFTPQRVETAKMIRPPSVTENTTRLLDEESERRGG
jgi:hypothetical protein